ncbi:MAG: hypothetical protein FJW83_02445 [Actinobacteria bacterium]|nr:hypothetical protein [Actinomycetota bacterium]
MCFVRWFSDVGRDDVAVVGGKVAALGEFRRALAPAGVDVPDGFAVTTAAFHAAFEHADTGPVVTAELPPSVVGGADLAALDAATARVRARFLGVPLPEALEAVVLDAHRQLLRSSAATRVARADDLARAHGGRRGGVPPRWAAQWAVARPHRLVRAGRGRRRGRSGRSACRPRGAHGRPGDEPGPDLCRGHVDGRRTARALGARHPAHGVPGA